MPDDSSRADWTNVAIAAVALLSLAFGGYGHFSGLMADGQLRVSSLEKEQLVSRKERVEMVNKLNVLWVDTIQNRDELTAVQKDVSRFNASFDKFATAVDRLSISVARLEERIGKN